MNTLLEAVGAGLTDDRTFEQQFGDRCPLCGEPWWSRQRCGPGEGTGFFARPRVRFCPQGHDISVVGRTSDRRCRECRRAFDRARKRHELKARQGQKEQAMKDGD